jgi:hypothetical protein
VDSVNLDDLLLDVRDDSFDVLAEPLVACCSLLSQISETAKPPPSSTNATWYTAHRLLTFRRAAG